MLAVDTVNQQLLLDPEIKQHYASQRPYKRWVVGKMIKPYEEREVSDPEEAALDIDDLTRVQKAFAYGTEDIERLLLPMIYEGKEPVGSMGNDTPIAVLSEFPKTIYRYFKQLFAQVTNPPIDPLRERLVMSLRTAVGGRAGLLDENESAAELIKFAAPVIDCAEFEWLTTQRSHRFQHRTLSCTFAVGGGPEAMQPALDELCLAAERAIDEGVSLLVLSDRDVDADHAGIPMLLATSAVHQHLIRAGKRTRVSPDLRHGRSADGPPLRLPARVWGVVDSPVRWIRIGARMRPSRSARAGHYARCRASQLPNRHQQWSA